MHPPSSLLLRSLRTSIRATSHTRGQVAASRFLTPCPLRRALLISRAFSDENSSNGTSRSARPTHQARSRSTSISSADMKPKSKYRGPAPEGTDAENMTDLSSLDIMSNVAVPATAIDACHDDGFQLNNGVKIVDGDGCLLVDGEVFIWRPWKATSTGAEKNLRSFINEKGQWEVPEDAWGALRLVWPKPDLLILGLGPTMRPLSPETRRHINELGVRVEVQDTRNAAAQFNLLATERGVREVAAALLPIG